MKLQMSKELIPYLYYTIYNIVTISVNHCIYESFNILVSMGINEVNELCTNDTIGIRT